MLEDSQLRERPSCDASLGCVSVCTTIPHFPTLFLIFPHYSTFSHTIPHFPKLSHVLPRWHPFSYAVTRQTVMRVGMPTSWMCTHRRGNCRDVLLGERLCCTYLVWYLYIEDITMLLDWYLFLVFVVSPSPGISPNQPDLPHILYVSGYFESSLSRT